MEGINGTLRIQIKPIGSSLNGLVDGPKKFRSPEMRIRGIEAKQ
jgi:hypothetical protein